MRPAPIMTVGLVVFVQLVTAAMMPAPSSNPSDPCPDALCCWTSVWPPLEERGAVDEAAPPLFLLTSCMNEVAYAGTELRRRLSSGFLGPAMHGSILLRSTTKTSEYAGSGESGRAKS